MEKHSWKSGIYSLPLIDSITECDNVAGTSLIQIRSGECYFSWVFMSSDVPENKVRILNHTKRLKHEKS
jgi:hypothetical protein